MKAWQINLLIIGGVLLLMFFLPEDISYPIALLIVLGSAIWVYNDAKKLEIQKYEKAKFSPSTHPLGFALFVWILWIIAFPMYISYRQKIKEGGIPLKVSSSSINNSQNKAQ